MKPYLYSEHAPAAPLAEHVLSYWNFETRLPADEQFLHHVWPDGCVSLTMVSGGGALLGASVVGPDVEARRVTVQGGRSYRGVRFWPDAGGRTLGVDVAALRGRSIPLQAVLGDDALRRAHAIAVAADWPSAAGMMDDWLRERLALPSLDVVMRGAVRQIASHRGEIPIATLANDVGIGVRQLQRRFRVVVGLTPKEYARVRRMRSGLGAVLRGERQWSTLAASLGYADQSHLIRDFTGMTGLTPGALEDRLDRIEHRQVEP